MYGKESVMYPNNLPSALKYFGELVSMSAAGATAPTNFEKS